jgi:hypothetical protein
VVRLAVRGNCGIVFFFGHSLMNRQMKFNFFNTDLL